MTGVTPADVDRVRRRLREDYEFFVDDAKAAKIVNKAGELVTMRLKRPQRRLIRALRRQREAGRPQRAIILKARQVGFSTVAQVVAIERCSQTPNHLALTVAQLRPTVAALFGIGETVWSNLPAQIKPPAPQARKSLEANYLVFREASRQLRAQGVAGLNSTYETATAKTAAAGRGRTIHTLHFSEVAFYPSDEMVLGIQNGVPDTPESLILKESTANGHNFFKDEWDLAEAGESAFYPMFTPWFEEEEYRLEFHGLEAGGRCRCGNEACPGELDGFEDTLGRGTKAVPEAGEDEPMLVTLIGEKLVAWADEDGEPRPAADVVRRRVLEHLHWRRWAIANKAQGKLRNFMQEYPSTPEEAFLSTGRKVFEALHVRRLIENHVNRTDPVVPSEECPGPARGLLRGTDVKTTVPRRGVTLEVPHGARWVPWADRERGELAEWRHWAAPRPERWVERDGGKVYVGPGQYLVNVDPASGEEDDTEHAHAHHAIEVIDHASRKQVAELEVQCPVRELALQAYLAALYWNRAWVTVERTGGWGLPVLEILAFELKWSRLYERETLDQRITSRQDRLGWDTSPETKTLLIAELERVLFETPELIRSRRVAAQMLTYIKDKRGRMKPEAGQDADCLMAYGIGLQIAKLRPLRKDKPPGAGKPSAAPRTVRSRQERWGGRKR